MLPRNPVCLVALTALLGALLQACPVAAAPPRLQARSVSEPVVLDGYLNDDAWRQGPAASGFTQREPAAGAPATEATEVRVAYTPTTLYIAIRALDSEPAKVRAREMEADGPLWRDDAVAILLDTFHDRRNGYFFETNPNGARADALIVDEGDSFNLEWDGVWEVRSRRTEEGWSAEMAIPFSTLRFASGSDTAGTWGMNVRRLIRRKNEETYWAPVPLEADMTRLSLAGTLAGLEGIAPALNLRAKPFAVAAGREALGAGGLRTGREAGLTTSEDMGLDLKLGIGRGLALDLTVNTDFAESEADEQQVNLSRYSLFLPEKREFFLENAGLFEFGPRPTFGNPLFRAFNSRRVGLGEDGTAVPIEWGARLTGRTGPWSVGLLDVRTGSEAGEAENWGVLRLRRQVGGETSVGMVATRHDSEAGANEMLGLDADWNPTSRLKVRTFWAGSRDGGEGSGAAGGIGASYRASTWRWSLDAMEIGESFDPEAGFLLRRGVRRYSPRLTLVPRPEIPGLRNLYFDARAEVFTDLRGELDSWFAAGDLFGFRTESDDAMSVFADRRFERLSEPFEIRPGVVIPAGEYRFGSEGVWFETNPSRAVSATGWIARGGFYDGDRLAHGATVRLRPSRFLRSESSWDRNHIGLPGGSFTTNLFRERLQVNLTPNLSTAALVQFSDAAELLGANLRLGWTYKPGADVFLVFNQTWDAPELGLRTGRDRQAILKMTYLISA